MATEQIQVDRTNDTLQVALGTGKGLIGKCAVSLWLLPSLRPSP